MQLYRLLGKGQALLRLTASASASIPPSVKSSSAVWGGVIGEGHALSKSGLFGGTQRSFSTSSVNDDIVKASNQNSTSHHTNYKNLNSSTASNFQKTFFSSKVEAQSLIETLVVNVEEVEAGSLRVSFAGGSQSSYQATWLRDNCQCSLCFNSGALARSLLMDDFKLKPKMVKVSVTNGGELEVVWAEDGHVSNYTSDWLKQRAFTVEARQKYQNRFQLPKVLWTSDHQLPEFTFSELMCDDRALLRWLLELETSGATLVNCVPTIPAAAYDLCQRVATAKATHYGYVSNVITLPDANNLAYTNQELNLHTDMPSYEDVPGILFLHMIEQNPGEGGDSIISDGFAAAEHLRRHHPKQFEILAETPVYFWDKGSGQRPGEMEAFYKINRESTIQVGTDGRLVGISFNNQIRDSFMDMASDQVDGFYEALMTFYQLMKDYSITFKMENGQMTVLDNIRCQHGKKAVIGETTTRRHLANAYMSWDEARCRRRRLEEQLGTG